MSIIETNRLILRPWCEDDAEALYFYAKDPKVGLPAGWMPHTSVEYSREIIRDVLSGDEIYAIVLKDTVCPVGSIGIMDKTVGHAPMSDTEREIGYWLGVPYWGQGMITEAMEAVIDRCFNKLCCTGLWCGYYEGNIGSWRVQEKCGFVYHHTEYDVYCDMIDEVHNEIFTYLPLTAQ